MFQPMCNCATKLNLITHITREDEGQCRYCDHYVFIGASDCRSLKWFDATRKDARPKVVRYSEQVINTAKTLFLEMQGNVYQTAKRIDIPKTTLHQWKVRYNWKESLI